MPGSSEWSAAVGQAWCDALPGLEATLAPLNPVLADALALAGASHVVDVGCGGGGFVRYLDEATGADTQITGIDISDAMIAQARRAGTSAGVRFVCADASRPVWDEPRADRLTSRFGVMFFEDEAKAFANMRSWLAPGGRFAFAVWGPMEANPWMHVVRQAVGAALPLPPFDPGQPGAVRYGEPERLVAQLRRAGFSGLEVTPWAGHLQLGGGLGARDAARFGLDAFWADRVPAGGRLHQRIAARLEQDLRPFEEDGRVDMAALAFVVSGSA